MAMTPKKQMPAIKNGSSKPVNAKKLKKDERALVTVVKALSNKSKKK